MIHITVDQRLVGSQIFVILYVKRFDLCNTFMQNFTLDITQFTHHKFTMDNINDLIAAIVDVEAKRNDNIEKCLDIARQGNHYG